MGGGGDGGEALLLYFKFTQSSHAVIFCTAVFVLPVSSHVVISRAFQGPPLKVRAHNTTSLGHSSSSSYPSFLPPHLLSDANQATKSPAEPTAAKIVPTAHLTCAPPSSDVLRSTENQCITQLQVNPAAAITSCFVRIWLEPGRFNKTEGAVTLNYASALSL